MPEYPYLEVAPFVGGQSFVPEALPDTGYDGALIVPIRVGRRSTRDSEGVELFMGDRFGVEVDAWSGELMLEDRSFPVFVEALGDIFIIGRKVLDQIEICFQFGW